MFFTNVNLVVVVIASVISTLISFIWYSPWFLGKPWMKAMKYTPESITEKNTKNMWKTYVFSFVSSFVMAFAVAVVLNSVFVSGISGLVLVGVVLSVGFIATTKFNDVIFASESLILFSINTGYQVVSVVVMSLIIGLFS